MEFNSVEGDNCTVLHRLTKQSLPLGLIAYSYKNGSFSGSVICYWTDCDGFEKLDNSFLPWDYSGMCMVTRGT